MLTTDLISYLNWGEVGVGVKKNSLKVFIGLTFVPMLHGWTTSTVLKPGWLEVSIGCYSNLAKLLFIIMSLAWGGTSPVYYVLGN